MIKVKESTVVQTAAAVLLRSELACLGLKGSRRGSRRVQGRAQGRGSGEAGSQFFVDETRWAMVEHGEGGQVARKRKDAGVGVAARGGEGRLARAFPSVGGRCGDDGRRAEFGACACELGGLMSR